MNTENLLSAFGEIDEEFFGENFSGASDNYGDVGAVEPVFVNPAANTAVKANRKKRLIAASAVAACGALIIGSGAAVLNRGNPDLLYKYSYDAKEVFPELTFAEEHKTVYNAEELYQVTRMEIDAEAIGKYGLPQLIDGDKCFFTHYPKTEGEEMKTGSIILFDNSSKEEKIIASYTKEKGDGSFRFQLSGIYGGYLYYIFNDNSENGTGELRRMDLNDHSTETMLSYDYSNLDPILSKTENCLYLYELKISDNYDITGGVYRIDLVTGETAYMEDAGRPVAYKDGFVYKKDDGNIYYHSSKESVDTVLFSGEYEDIRAVGKESLLYTRASESEGDSSLTELGVKDENGERTLVIGEKLVSDLTFDCSSSESGLALLVPIGGKPFIYDSDKDRFSFVNTDGTCLAYAPSGFADNGSVSFMEVKPVDGENSARAELVTVKRRADDPDNTDDPDTDKSLLEMPSAEELYDVRKYEFYSDKGNYQGLNLEMAVSAFKKQVYFGKVWYYDNELFVTSDKGEDYAEEAGPNFSAAKATAKIYGYNMEEKERRLVLENAPENPRNDLSLQIAGIFDNVIYYYQIESGGEEEAPQKISLRYSDMRSSEHGKIFDLEAGREFLSEPVVKTKEHIYFVDNGATAASTDDDNSKIYRYNINTKQVEIFKDNAKNPTLCSCKNGFIYYSLGQYCRIYDEKGDRDLEVPNLYGKISPAGDNIFFARRGEYSEHNTLVEIYDESLTLKESVTLPNFTELAVNDNFAKEGSRGLAYLDIQFTSRELAEEPEGYIRLYSVPVFDLRADKNIYEALIYDGEKDIFSVLELKEGQRVVYAAKTDEGLMLFTANEDYSQVEYYIVAKGDNGGGAGDAEIAAEETP